MRGEAIFGPVGALAGWTMLILFLTGIRRVGAVRARRVKRGDFRLGESDEVPADVAIANRNLMNLLEVPVLFYVICLSLFVTRQVHPGLVGLAWAYVALRVLHSLIHLTTNNISHRLIMFVLSNVVLVAIWIAFLRHLT